MIDLEYSQGKIINADVLEPEMVVATFDDATPEQLQKEVVICANAGNTVMNLWDTYRTNLHISNMNDFLSSLDTLFIQWETDMYNARKER